jgi:tryptophanyl-tRNA synthetase
MRVVSGIQPSGVMQLGNYLGAINNWLGLQHEHDCFLFLADLHTITVYQDPKILNENIINTAATYLASGIDFKKVTLFAQSDVPQHAELSWILGCMTPLGWLKRMTQFKEKSGLDKERASLGLFSYPVLQAADILLYHADLVPVGDDQRQHLELARDIAASFNRHVNEEFFKLPNALIAKESARIMSLKDGSKKMSKSDPSDSSKINMTDNADSIMQKIKRAKTDSISQIYYDKTNRPEVSNLINIYSCISGKSIESVVSFYQESSLSVFKQDLASLLIEKIIPIGNKIKDMSKNDKMFIISVLKEGAEKARSVADENINKIKKLCGFILD